MVKGGGHGCYRVIVLAPASAQEMCDFTRLAFELADRYRNPACVLADGTIGQMMEPVAFSAPAIPLVEPPWAVRGDRDALGNFISSIHLDHQELETHIQALARKYAEIERQEARHEAYRLEDAEVVLVAYGIVARIAYSAVDAARARGIRAGLLRPITLWPFPTRVLAELAVRARRFLALELSTGQMVEDVRLAISGRRPVHFHGRSGGMLPTVEEIVTRIAEIDRESEEDQS
jgi:pyruvate/2-oxoacid:ferredoxin oxidoreductase alpha subunit